ncbi:MAG: outer membrane beta-barrel protein [Bacteroidetes bacterium]|nr:outer membrane beta-barrel protein [Bacteroidota bacterium]
MKKIVLVFAGLVMLTAAFAQAPASKSAKDKKKKDQYNALVNGASDHFMIQINSDQWAGAPDSISSHKKGLSRGFNMYVMINKPFKNSPQLSVAYGVGVGTTNMYFKNMNVDVKSLNTKLPFTALDSTDHFKKYKLSTAFLEVPVELRFIKDPEHENKSLKGAIGIKVGTLLNVHTKGKLLQNKSGGTINSYTDKITDKRFFNSTRLAATARIGYGNISLYGSYQFTALLKDGVGPVIHPFEIGISLSGL